MAYQPKSYRKFLATTAAAAMAATAVVPAAVSADEHHADRFSDYGPEDTGFEEAMRLVDAGVITGYPDGTYKPYESLMRHQAAAFFYRSLELEISDEEMEEILEGLNDVNPDSTNAREIAAGIKEGIFIVGENFRPGEDLRRDQFASLLVRAFELEPNPGEGNEVTDIEGAYHQENIEIVLQNGIYVGVPQEDGTRQFQPTNALNRGGMAQVLVRTFDIAGWELPTPAEEEALVAESTTDIDGTSFEFTLTMSEDVEGADLSDAVVNLTRSSVNVEAEFVSASGNEATFAVKEEFRPQNMMPNGNYTITADFFETDGSLTAAFVRDVSATSIQGIVVDEDDDAMGGVTVSAGGETTVTDSFGYYYLPATAGEVEVEFSREGYFTQTEDVNVRRNSSTAAHATMEEKDVSKVFIESNVINNATGQGVVDAEVHLQVQDEDGDWDTVQTAVTTSGNAGYFVFANTQVTSEDLVSDSNPAATGDVVRLGTGNQLSFDEEYRIVVQKDILDSDGEFRSFSDNFITIEDEFMINQDGKRTSELYRMDRVQANDEVHLDVEWTEDANLTTTDLSVTLIHPDGETRLASGDNAAVLLENVKAANEDELENGLPIDLVDKGFFSSADGATVDTVRLPEGTYYLKVDDGLATNGVAIASLEVSGSDSVVESSTAVIDQAARQTANATLSSFPNRLAAAFDATEDTVLVTRNTAGTVFETSSSNTTVDAAVATYIDVDGQSVRLTDSSTQNVQYVGDAFEVNLAGGALNRLPVGSLAFELEGDYVTSAEQNFTGVAGSTGSTSMNFDALGQVNFNITSEDGASTTLDNLTIELLDTDEEVVYTIENADPDEVVKGVSPGDYYVRVSADGYETKTSASPFNIIEFEERILDEMVLEEVEAPVLTGFARLQDQNFTAAGTGDVIAYYFDEDEGEDGEYVIASQTTIDDAGFYELDDFTRDHIGETVTVVVRGAGNFESYSEQRTLVGGENDAMNFELTSGGRGQVDFVLYDERGAALSTDDLSVVMIDPFTKVEYSDIEDVSTADNAGYFFPQLRDDSKTNYTSGQVLSAGVYELVIEKSGYEDFSTFVTVNRNGTTNAGIIELEREGGDEIKFTVSGSVAGSATTPDSVVALDENREVVERAQVRSNGEYSIRLAGNNSNYTLVALRNGDFVGSQDITVQDFDKTNVNFSLTEAVR